MSRASLRGKCVRAKQHSQSEMCQSTDTCSRICGMDVISEYFNSCGHLVGMLHRDQRTAKIPTYSKTNCTTSITSLGPGTESVSNTSPPLCRENPQSTRVYRHPSGWRKHRLWKIWLKLKQVLIVGTYLLSIVSIPKSLSAPLNRHMAERLNSHPKWINPCGYSTDETDDLQDNYSEIPQVSSSELLSRIIKQAEIAYSKANLFKEQYALKMHGVDTETLHQHWKDRRFDWLPSFQDIPKNLGEKIPTNAEFLSTLQMDKKLIDIYEQLQKYAVGLEQIVWDQEDEHGLFRQNFTDTEFYLRSLLCEVQEAILERGLKQKPDVTRELMKDEFRNYPDATSRYVRDWLIYRDYLNALEFTMEAFSFIGSNL